MNVVSLAAFRAKRRTAELEKIREASRLRRERARRYREAIVRPDENAFRDLKPWGIG